LRPGAGIGQCADAPLRLLGVHYVEHSHSRNSFPGAWRPAGR
jgi:hypothetical protein